MSFTRDGWPVKTKISDVVDRIGSMAEQAIVDNGGQKNTNKSGEAVCVRKTDF